MLKRLFLPVGLLAAVAGGALVPAPGAWLRAHHGVQLFIVTIFLVNGWTVKLDRKHLNRRLWTALGVTAILSLVFSPWLGTWLGQGVFGLEGPVGTGMIVMATVPVTLSSAIVISATAGGNAVWALIMTLGMNLAGIVSVPIMLKLCLQDAAGPQISATHLLLKLVMLVLVPFVLGHLAHRLVRGHTPRALGYVPSLCVILTVYAAFSASRDDVLGTDPASLPAIVGAALSIHITLFLLANLAARVLRLEVDEQKSVCFVGSQKSLPIAISVLTALSINTALALLPCLVFHFSQLLLDSCIAGRWRR